MKEEVRLLIKDLQYACHQSLFNGIIGGVDDGTAAESVTKDRTFQGSSETTVSNAHSQVAKRRRKDDTTTYISKSWDTVSFKVSTTKLRCMFPIYLFLTLLSEIVSLVQS